MLTYKRNTDNLYYDCTNYYFEINHNSNLDGYIYGQSVRGVDEEFKNWVLDQMEDNKLDTITNLFEGKEIRIIWDSEKEEYFFSVVDVISALTDSTNPRDYWYKLKTRMTEVEKSELSTKCLQLKMKAQDGKMRETDTLNTKGILRLIESVPSPKAEPFKLWLAQMGKERIDEVFDPELAVNRAVDYYRSKRI